MSKIWLWWWKILFDVHANISVWKYLQSGILSVFVTTVKECCCVSWRKKGWGWGWNCPRGWECLFLLLRRIGSRCPLGISLALVHAHVPPSAAAKVGRKAGGRSAQLVSVFFCHRQALQPLSFTCLMPKATLPAALTRFCIPFIQLKHNAFSCSQN